MHTLRVALCVPNYNWQETDPGVHWHFIPYALCMLAATVRDICQIDIIDANKNNLTVEVE